MKITYTYKNGNGDQQKVTEEVSLSLWKNHGLRRVYINDEAGRAIGFYNIETRDIETKQNQYFYSNFAAHIVEEAGLMPAILKIAGIETEETAEEPATETPEETPEAIAAEVAAMDWCEIQEAANAEFKKVNDFEAAGEMRWQAYDGAGAKLDWYAHLCGRCAAGKIEGAAGVKALREGLLVEMPHQRAWELVCGFCRL